MKYDIGNELIYNGLKEEYASTARVLLSNLGLHPGNTTKSSIGGNITKSSNGYSLTMTPSADGKEKAWVFDIVKEGNVENAKFNNRLQYSLVQGESASYATINGLLETDKGFYYYTSVTASKPNGETGTFNPETNQWNYTNGSFEVSVIFYDKTNAEEVFADLKDKEFDEMRTKDYTSILAHFTPAGIEPDASIKMNFVDTPAKIANHFIKESEGFLIKEVNDQMTGTNPFRI